MQKIVPENSKKLFRKTIPENPGMNCSRKLFQEIIPGKFRQIIPANYSGKFFQQIIPENHSRKSFQKTILENSRKKKSQKIPENSSRDIHRIVPEDSRKIIQEDSIKLFQNTNPENKSRIFQNIPENSRRLLQEIP